jgi:lipopolysaccharide transport system ATP-binding protein
MAALTRIQDKGATVLFVSHDIDALKSLCSRGIYLERGTIHLIGTAGEVAEHYTRRMREEMNAEHISTVSIASGSQTSNSNTSLKNMGVENMNEFKTSTEFEKHAAQSRYGEGGAKIIFAELLDGNMRGTTNVEFNQAVFIRIYLEASIDEEVSCNYYILDDKRNYILGAGLELAGEPLLHIKSGQRYIVTYKTCLPLREGWHSVQLEITKSVIKDQAAIFLDVIDNALIFTMLRRQEARIWAKAFVRNEVEIISC